MLVTGNMVLFWGGGDYLSNFYPVTHQRDGELFFCVEQDFMYQKALHFGDTHVANLILNIDTNARNWQLDCKKLGRQVRNYNDAEWSRVREQCMYEACLAKFKANPHLQDQLLATGCAIIVEASPYDKIWGCGFAEHDLRAQQPTKWTGKNLLGRVLMSVRQTLQERVNHG